MKFVVQTVATAAVAVLALGMGGASASADDDTWPAGPGSCSIRNQGDGENVACGDLVVGNNNTVGQGHQTVRDVVGDVEKDFVVGNNSGYSMRLISTSNMASAPAVYPAAGSTLGPYTQNTATHNFSVTFIFIDNENTGTATYEVLDSGGVSHGTIDAYLSVTGGVAADVISCSPHPLVSCAYQTLGNGLAFTS